MVDDMGGSSMLYLTLGQAAEITELSQSTLFGFPRSNKEITEFCNG
jgi:hypothetical protein